MSSAKLLKAILFIILAHLSLNAQAQKVTVITLPTLDKLMNQANDTTYVVNFWATWCKPCIQELPYFEKLQANYSNKKVKVLLISMDFASKLKEKVEPFVKKRNLKSSVFLINEPDQNALINQVDKDWSGAIPFTLILNHAQKLGKGYEKEFTWEELQAEIRTFIQ